MITIDGGGVMSPLSPRCPYGYDTRTSFSRDAPPEEQSRRAESVVAARRLRLPIYESPPCVGCGWRGEWGQDHQVWVCVGWQAEPTHS